MSKHSEPGALRSTRFDGKSCQHGANPESVALRKPTLVLPPALPQVHDYAGASMMRMDANVKQASKRIIQLFQVTRRRAAPFCRVLASLLMQRLASPGRLRRNAPACRLRAAFAIIFDNYSRLTALPQAPVLNVLRWAAAIPAGQLPRDAGDQAVPQRAFGHGGWLGPGGPGCARGAVAVDAPRGCSCLG